MSSKGKKRQKIVEAHAQSCLKTQKKYGADLAAEAKLQQALLRKKPRHSAHFDTFMDRLREGVHAPAPAPHLGALEETIRKRAPKLDDERYVSGFAAMLSETWEQPIKDWRPKGKAPDTQFRSLVRYLLVKYPLPSFIFSAFFMPEETCAWAIRLFLYLARGGSLYKATQPGSAPNGAALVPVPLTKRMCHEILQATSGYTVIQAIRRAQILAFGGNFRLTQIICQSRIGERFYANEVLLAQTIQWFCQQPMLDAGHVGPIFDWVFHRAGENPEFSMKGRTGTSVLVAIDEWHNTLAKTKVDTSADFQSCGIEGWTWERKKNVDGESYLEPWVFSEILTAKDLIEEGKRLHHCVYSYASSIERKCVSIWSLRVEGVRTLTIELMVSSRTIVQIRGFANRPATTVEKRVIEMWASKNGIAILKKL